MTATITETTYGSIKVIKFAWATASSSSGGTTGVTTGYHNGSLIGAAFIPGTAGSQPTASYDATVVDNNSVDVLLGTGANLSNAATVYKKTASLAAVGTSKLTLNITNAGSSHAGVVVLYYR